MKSFLHILVVVLLAIFVMSCSKDEQPSSAPGDKNDMYRGWTTKGKRTPAPTPGRVFNKG